MSSGSATITPQTGHLNVSPAAFRHWASHFLKCRDDFKSPDSFSPVPYFLLCRVLELVFKAQHLEIMRQKEVKHLYWHDLVALYDALDQKHQILTSDERSLLVQANDVYEDKAFEYFSIMDAVTGFKRFPNLAALDTITRKIVQHGA
jgi:hypothetical protein